MCNPPELIVPLPQPSPPSHPSQSSRQPLRGGQPTRRRAHTPRRLAPSRGLPPARTQASACGCVSWPSAPPCLARPSLTWPASTRAPLCVAQRCGLSRHPACPACPAHPALVAVRLAHRGSVPSRYKAHRLVRAAAATQAQTASLRPGVYAELAPTSAEASSEQLALSSAVTSRPSSPRWSLTR